MTLPSIKSIGRIMADQNNRSTQYPMFAVLSDTRHFVGRDGDWDGKERAEDETCARCLQLAPDLPDSCDTCEWYYYTEDREVDLRAGIFFTDVACQQHIDDNSYHYSNPEVYAISAWRNPEMVAVQRHLIVVEAGKPLPMHYE